MITGAYMIDACSLTNIQYICSPSWHILWYRPIPGMASIARKCQSEDIKGRFLRYVTYYSIDEVFAYYRDAGFSEVAISETARGFSVILGKKR